MKGVCLNPHPLLTNKTLEYYKAMKQTLIKEYIRNKKNDPREVAVAIKSNDQVFYGYSLCNPCDKYNKEFGINIAVNRALATDGYSLPESPETVRTIVANFKKLEARALRYFKDVAPENIVFDAE